MWKKFVCVYAVLLVTFTVLLVAVHVIPSRLLAPNVLRSAQTIEDEGIFRQIGNVYLLQLDNMTDCMMLNMAVTADSEHPVTAAMNNYYGCHSDSESYENMALNTQRIAADGPQAMPERMHYGRYWQGIQVLLRPLLLVTDYQGMRVLNFILLTSLLLWLLTLTVRRMSWWPAAALCVSLLAVGAPIVPLSIQLSVCFYIMLAASIWMFYIRSIHSAPIVFFIIGALTAYMDFLTVPQLTLGVPMVMLLLLQRPVRACRWVIGLSVAWLGGYALLWASKWLIAYVLTGQSIMDTVASSVSLRLSDSVVFHGEQISIDQLVLTVLGLLRWWMVAALAVIVGLLGWIYSRFQQGWDVIRRHSWLLLVALIVPVWFVCLRNHSIQHIFFTWRAWLLPLFSLLMFVYYTVKPHKL